MTMEYGIEQFTCGDCGEVAGEVRFMTAHLPFGGDPESYDPGGYVEEPPETCPDCGSDNLNGEEA